MGASGGSQNSNSSSYGYNQSLAQSVSGQSIWGPQATNLEALYGRASGLLNSQGGIQGTAAGNVAGVMPGAKAGMGALQGIAGGGGPLSEYAKPNNELARTQTQNYANTIGDAFKREILPGITSASLGTGNMGGSRDALARGVAAGDAAKAIAQGGTDLYAQQYGIGAQAAGQQQQGMLAAGTALPEVATSIYNLGMMPSQAAWAPLMSMAGILGGPQALSYSRSAAQTQGEQASQQVSKGSNWGFSFF